MRLEVYRRLAEALEIFGALQKMCNVKSVSLGVQTELYERVFVLKMA